MQLPAFAPFDASAFDGVDGAEKWNESVDERSLGSGMHPTRTDHSHEGSACDAMCDYINGDDSFRLSSFSFNASVGTSAGAMCRKVLIGGSSQECLKGLPAAHARAGITGRGAR